MKFYPCVSMAYRWHTDVYHSVLCIVIRAYAADYERYTMIQVIEDFYGIEEYIELYRSVLCIWSRNRELQRLDLIAGVAGIISVSVCNRAWRDVAGWQEWSDEGAAEVDMSFGRFVGDAPCVERLVMVIQKGWNLSYKVGMKPFGGGLFLFSFSSLVEANRILQSGKLAFGGYCLLLDRWVPRAGHPKQESEKVSLWIRVFGLPLHGWCSDTLRAVGEACWSTVHVDPISVGWNVEMLESLFQGFVVLHTKYGGVKDRLGGRVDVGVQNNRGAFARLGLAVNSEAGCEVVQDGNTAGGRARIVGVGLMKRRYRVVRSYGNVDGKEKDRRGEGHFRYKQVYSRRGRKFGNITRSLDASLGNESGLRHPDGKVVFGRDLGRGVRGEGDQSAQSGPKLRSIVIRLNHTHTSVDTDLPIESVSSRERFRLLRSCSCDSLGSSSETLVKPRHSMSSSDGMGLEEQPWAQREGMPEHDKLENGESLVDSDSHCSESGESQGGSSNEEGLWRMQVVEPDGEIANLVESKGSTTCTNDMEDEEEGGAKMREFNSNVAKSIEIKIIAWNVRGLGRGEKRLDVKSLLRKIKPDLVAIQETKLEELNARVVSEVWDNKNVDWVFVPSVGASGK
ncbi:hypothetical protein HHK36_000858 [Tetracentron sinense]|uniref:DUF4283 domain-containing protein n=1 Tax=Tetracentron sinense TaxID=13715 RepID=A0A834ZSX6_TETSI|nr:hypothetical protein HHK36_000858 [Tetracentron sinense]